MSPKNVRVKLPGTDARAGMSRPRKSPAEAADEYCENNTTPEKVFGVPLGETLPASPPTDVKDEEKFDSYGTELLTAELCEVYAAMYVKGDGNCFWRAFSMAIWGTAKYWRQVKLVVLGWATANVDALVGEGGILHKCGTYYPDRCYKEHIFLNAEGEHCPDRDNYKMMLLASIGLFCGDHVWGGYLTALLAAHALRIPVKFLVPTDKRSRMRYDREGQEPPHGTGRDGLQIDDNRHSRAFVPDSRLKLRVRGADGKGDAVREEIAIALYSYSDKGVCESALADIPEVDWDTSFKYESLNHFSAIMSKDGGTTPFPMFKVAPMLSSKRASLGKQHVEDRVLKSAEPLMRQLESVGGSTYARNELTAEMLASAAYDTSVLAEGQGCHDYLERLATQAGDHLDVCAKVPEEAFRGSKAPDISMWGTTSLGSFVEVVRNVKIDCVVHVVYKYTDRPVGHIVVVGPDGFQLCTCLRLMRCGLHCSHTLAALVTKLGRAEEFLGESIHPRWRTSLEPWSLYSAGLSPFDGHERGTYTDGFTGDYGDMDLEDSHDGPAGGAVSIPRGRFYADLFARVTKLVSAASDNYDGTPASYARYNELFDRFGRDVNATIMAPVVADGVTGLGNPPLPVSKTRKETRHNDGFEGRPKKKAKGGDTTSCVDVAN
eukprot:jgi/Undpi1/7786/HiC_scaffold_23.g10259.m1